MASWYREACGLRCRWIDLDGAVATGRRGAEVDALPMVRQARAHALQEAVRWGEPYTFFLAPGVISWVVPVVDRYNVVGGMLGGEVLTDGHVDDRDAALRHFTGQGGDRRQVADYLHRLPVWPQVNCQAAVEKLHEIVYRVSGLSPLLLQEKREQHLQQRQIAEAIHLHKRRQNTSYGYDEEQLLLSLIRAADRKGARRILNQMLGRVFIQSANLTVIRARVIEMMGYLVRRAVEDSPFLAPIMEKNHQWMARIIEAEQFEDLAVVVRQALDDFMDHVYESGYTEVHPRVSTILDYLQAHYREAVTLQAVAAAAGLSTYRTAHLMKQETGRTVIQYVHHLRIKEAQRLLNATDRPCADIALEVGFCDQSYFTRQFHRLVGMTPAQYRRRTG